MNRLYSCNALPNVPVLLILFCLCYAVFSADTCLAANDTMIVSAEGLADPDDEAFRHNKEALDGALVEDAKKQAIEKVVGMYIDTKSLEQNYQSIDEGVLTQTNGYIKRIIQKSEPWLGEDGFMHILIKAEVYTTKAQVALQDMSRRQRVQFLRKVGDPRISVAIMIKDHDRDSRTAPQRSSIAENVLKEYIADFGYRVFSEKTAQKRNEMDAKQSLAAGNTEQVAYYANRKYADFVIRGDVKFKQVSIKLKTSGLEINKRKITSWTVKCIDNVSGEELYFNNKIPARKAWSTEDEALKSIGQLMGEEFSKEFFQQHLMQQTAVYELEVQSLPLYDAAVLFKNELVGLRPILNVELRSFDSIGGAMYEVEFSGRELDFSEYINKYVLTPLNYKFGQRAFSLISIQRKLVKVAFQGSKNQHR